MPEMDVFLLVLLIICGIFFPIYKSDNSAETCDTNTCKSPIQKSIVNDEIEGEIDEMTIETPQAPSFTQEPAEPDEANLMKEDAPEECDPTACRGEGTCVIVNGKTKCQCLPQYFTGKDCSIQVDNCQVNVFSACDPRGTERCIPYFGGRYCKCRRGYYGTTCSQRHPSSYGYLLPNSLPAVYFPHTIFEKEQYTFYVVFENKSDTMRCSIAVDNQNFYTEITEFKKNNKLSYYMGLDNYPKTLRK